MPWHCAATYLRRLQLPRSFDGRFSLYGAQAPNFISVAYWRSRLSLDAASGNRAIALTWACRTSTPTHPSIRVTLAAYTQLDFRRDVRNGKLPEDALLSNAGLLAPWAHGALPHIPGKEIWRYPCLSTSLTACPQRRYRTTSTSSPSKRKWLPPSRSTHFVLCS